MKARNRPVARGIMVFLRVAILVALAATFQIAPAKTTESIWNASFGGTLADVAYCVLQTNDGGYITAGSTESFGAGSSDCWLVKVNASGAHQWNRTYGGAYSDEARYIQQTSDGGYVVGGSTKSFGAGDADFWLIKSDTNGIMQWSKTYGGIYEDRAMCVQQTSDAGYVMAGYTNSFGAGGSDFWLVKTDADGNAQWSKTYGGTGFDRSFSVAQTVDGGYVLAGETNSYGAGNSDFWLVKINSVGTVVWNRTAGGAQYDAARSVQQTTDGGFVAAGLTNSFGEGGTDFMLVKTDSSGVLQWNRTYGDRFDEESYSVELTSDGGCIAAGGTTSSGMGGWDSWLVKTDGFGNPQWNQANGGVADDRAYSVRQTGDGGYIAVGGTESYGAGGSDFWLNKLMTPQQKPPDEDPPPPLPEPGEPIPGDINDDGTVDGLDLIRLREAYGSSPNSLNWDYQADINGDSIVDDVDLFILGQNFGETANR